MAVGEGLLNESKMQLNWTALAAKQQLSHRMRGRCLEKPIKEKGTWETRKWPAWLHIGGHTKWCGHLGAQAACTS